MHDQYNFYRNELGSIQQNYICILLLEPKIPLLKFILLVQFQHYMRVCHKVTHCISLFYNFKILGNINADEESGRINNGTFTQQIQLECRTAKGCPFYQMWDKCCLEQAKEMRIYSIASFELSYGFSFHLIQMLKIRCLTATCRLPLKCLT